MSRAKRSPRGILRGAATPRQDGGSSPSATTGPAGCRDAVPPDETEARTAPGASPETESIPSKPSEPSGRPVPASPPPRHPAPTVGAPGPARTTGPTADDGPAAGDTGRPVPAGVPRSSGRRTTRLRLSEADPWSVMVMSFFFLTGLGAVSLVTAGVLWLMLEAITPDALPATTTALVVALGVITVEIILGTWLMTLGAFLYNLSAQYSGGVEIAVADALTGPTPAAARVLMFIARTRARARRRLRARTGDGDLASDTV
ncbi:DUF3566 domain-containing protein [Streptomyces sp. NRRL S-31]|uniref:DUF3566 domain-containing protein n=1 Tax=Streptomyces sp. NRRL S-31 TaxID=1463898 RepID=UPI0009A124D3|nr:DUF3566 domain-containing protein [Streptomyces sp. NRRL S-31]